MDHYNGTALAENWAARADWLQDSFWQHYYNADSGIMNQWYPREYSRAGDNFYYWWQAHVIDVLTDAYERTGIPNMPNASAA